MSGDVLLASLNSISDFVDRANPKQSLLESVSPVL